MAEEPLIHDQSAGIERLLEIAWGDWPVERISRHLDAIRGGDIAALEAAAGTEDGKDVLDAARKAG